MRSELIFADTKDQTMLGFKRTFVALVIIIPLIILWHWLLSGIYPGYIMNAQFYIGFALLTILFASSIAVAHPRDVKTAAVYGGLVGLVVFGAINAFLLMAQYNWKYAVLDIVFGTVLGVVTSIALFYL